MLAHAAHRTVLTLTVMATCVAAATAQQRTWTDDTGKLSVEAEFVETKQGSVVLKKRTGSVITVPLARLSENDRRYLQSLARGPTREPVRPAPEVVTAWKKAGAKFYPAAKGVPRFDFRMFPTDKLDVLPPPEFPFGLSLQSVTDVELKDLAELTQLQSLDLGGTEVSDVGLRELAELKQLQTLNLRGTKVTSDDAGLKDLAGLKQLDLAVRE